MSDKAPVYISKRIIDEIQHRINETEEEFSSVAELPHGRWDDFTRIPGVVPSAALREAGREPADRDQGSSFTPVAASRLKRV